METTLWEQLGWKSSSKFIPENHDENVLILDNFGCGYGANQMLYQYISSYLYNEIPVCIISSNYTLSHYIAVLKRIGVNLSASKYNKKLYFIDALSVVHSEDFKEKNSFQKLKFIGGEYTLRNMENGREIFEKLEEIGEEIGENQKILVVIDDFNSLEVLFDDGYSGIIDLVHYIRYESNKNVNVVGICEKHEALNPLVECLGRAFETVLEVKPLQTGRSDSVDGQLFICKRMGFTMKTEVGSGSHQPVAAAVLFKATQTSIKYFYP